MLRVVALHITREIHNATAFSQTYDVTVLTFLNRVMYSPYLPPGLAKALAFLFRQGKNHELDID